MYTRRITGSGLPLPQGVLRRPHQTIFQDASHPVRTSVQERRPIPPLSDACSDSSAILLRRSVHPHDRASQRLRRAINHEDSKESHSSAPFQSCRAIIHPPTPTSGEVNVSTTPSLSPSSFQTPTTCTQRRGNPLLPLRITPSSPSRNFSTSLSTPQGGYTSHPSTNTVDSQFYQQADYDQYASIVVPHADNANEAAAQPQINLAEALAFLEERARELNSHTGYWGKADVMDDIVGGGSGDIRALEDDFNLLMQLALRTDATGSIISQIWDAFARTRVRVRSETLNGLIQYRSRQLLSPDTLGIFLSAVNKVNVDVDEMTFLMLFSITGQLKYHRYDRLNKHPITQVLNMLVRENIKSTYSNIYIYIYICICRSSPPFHVMPCHAMLCYAH